MYKKIVSFSLLLGVLALQAMQVNTKDQDLWVMVDAKEGKTIKGYLLTYDDDSPVKLPTNGTTVIPATVIAYERLHESLSMIHKMDDIPNESKRILTALEIMQ